jgi:hypothetical protein
MNRRSDSIVTELFITKRRSQEVEGEIVYVNAFTSISCDTVNELL